MEEVFHQSAKFDKSQLKNFKERIDTPATQHLLFVLLLFVLALYFLFEGLMHINILQLLIGIVFYVVVYCSSFAMLHETVHNTAFKTRWKNKIASQIAGVLQFYTPAMFSEFHFEHHRHTHELGRDPEITVGKFQVPESLGSYSMYFAWISGFPLFALKFTMLIAGALGMPEFMRASIFPFVNKKNRVKLLLDSWLVLIVYSFAVLFAIKINTDLLYLLVLIPIANCVLANYIIAEHGGLPHNGNIFEKTRSMKVNSFVKFVMWNMPYHAEHHAYPAIPFYQLPKVHEILSDEIIHKNETYSDVHLNGLKGKYFQH